MATFVSGIGAFIIMDGSVQPISASPAFTFQGPHKYPELLTEKSGVVRAAAAFSQLIERRFGLPLDTDDVRHLRHVWEHYRTKRDALLWQFGEMDAMRRPEYAKAVLISEAARAMLREIAPKRRKNSRKDSR